MSDKKTIVFVLAAAAFLGGCAKSAKTQASLGVMRPDAPVLSLGAGDSLGQRVYMNDLIIAARGTSNEVAVTAVSESMPIDLGE